MTELAVLGGLKLVDMLLGGIGGYNEYELQKMDTETKFKIAEMQLGFSREQLLQEGQQFNTKMKAQVQQWAAENGLNAATLALNKQKVLGELGLAQQQTTADVGFKGAQQKQTQAETVGLQQANTTEAAKQERLKGMRGVIGGITKNMAVTPTARTAGATALTAPAPAPQKINPLQYAYKGGTVA